MAVRPCEKSLAKLYSKRFIARRSNKWYTSEKERETATEIEKKMRYDF